MKKLQRVLAILLFVFAAIFFIDLMVYLRTSSDTLWEISKALLPVAGISMGAMMLLVSFLALNNLLKKR